MFEQQHFPEDLGQHMHAEPAQHAAAPDRQEGSANMEPEYGGLCHVTRCVWGCKPTMPFILNHACCNSNR